MADLGEEETAVAKIEEISTAVEDILKNPPEEEETAQQSPALDTNCDENFENDIPSSCNPTLSEDMRGYVDKMKGDAIGDTLYSSRFVLKILIRLATDPQVHTPKLDEDFEKELCTFWDMTIERDVVKMLLEQQVIDLFATVIESTEDNRLIEILLGIVANMCALSASREALCHSPTALSTFLDAINSPDPLILDQLMRLIHAALVFENNGDELAWFQHFQSSAFVEQFAFILKNSMSSTLLVNSYMALNAICSKFSVIEIQPDNEQTIKSFYETFVTNQLVDGVAEAFSQMCPHSLSDDDSSDMSAPSKTTKRIASLFLDLCVALSPYGNISLQAFQDHLDKIYLHIGQILQPLCHSMYLLPLTIHETGIIELVNEFGQSVGDPFYGGCFGQIIRIWSLIDDHQRNSNSTINGAGSEWEADDGDNDGLCEDDVLMTILEFITRTSRQATEEAMAEAVAGIESDLVYRLYQVLVAGDGEPDIKECCNKLKAASVLHNWNWQVTEVVDIDEGVH